MTILNKYKRWNPLLLIDEKNIWDFVLDKNTTIESNKEIEKCVDIDFSQKECFYNNEIQSLRNYKWGKSINNNVILKNIGLTGVDSGYISFDSVYTTNEEYLNLLTNSVVEFDKGDYSLHLKPVNSNNNVYDFSYSVDIEGEYMKLNGGFFQGFYKAYGEEYQILPTTVETEWNLNFIIRPQDYEITDKTLNKIYSKNKGIFFYMGTRSENKFLINYGCDFSDFEKRKEGIGPMKTCSVFYEGYYSDPSGDYFNDGYLLEEKELLNETIVDENGVEVEPEGYYEIKTDNKFLFFNNTKDGYNVDTWVEGTEVIIGDFKRKKTPNLYLLMNNTKDGYIVDNIDSYTSEEENKKPSFKDITNNAFALKINDDGSIGYRYLVSGDCDTEYKIIEEHSKPNIIKKEEWNDIKVKIVNINSSNIKIYIYIENKLKFISKEIPNFNFRELDEFKTKQEGVPYNISLGGGTMGLCNSMWLKYYSIFGYILPIEKYFAGSFIGDIKSFTFSTND